MTLQTAKAEWRAKIRTRLSRLSAAERATGAIRICQRVRTQVFWQMAGTVLLFAPLPEEANVWPLLEQALAEGKVLALPRYDPVKKAYAAARITDLTRDLVTAAYGVREPTARCSEILLANIDLALVPGLGFDLSGNRLGRGWGFYDRLLADFRGIKCGVALDEQVVESIPAEQHDVRMDLILTPAHPSP